MARPTTAGLFQQNGSAIWYCRWHDDSGKLHRKSTGKTDKTDAEQVYNSLRIAANCKPDPSAIITVNTVLDLYHAKRGYELKGKGYRDGKRQLIAFFNATPWAELGQKGEGKRNVRNYIALRKKTVKPGSINREIGILSAAANVAIAEGLEIRNYAEGQRLEVPTTQYYWLTHDQAVNLIEATKPRHSYRNSDHLHDYCIIALGTGMRMTEILQLRRADISLRHNVIRLPTSKSAEPHEIPLSDSVQEAIASRIKRATELQTPYLFANADTLKPIKTIIAPFKRAAKRAGIPVTDRKLGTVGFRVHDTRHTVASWLVQGGSPLEAVQDLLNHSDIRTTQRYAHHSPAARKATVAKLPKL